MGKGVIAVPMHYMPQLMEQTKGKERLRNDKRSANSAQQIGNLVNKLLHDAGFDFATFGLLL